MAWPWEHQMLNNDPLAGYTEEELARAIRNPGHHGDKIMEEQIQPTAAWDIPARDIRAMNQIYRPPPGAMEGCQAKVQTPPLGASLAPLTLGALINNRINALQGHVEKLQLLRSKLAAGKLDSITMAEFEAALGRYL